jgi:hypothetical protein
MAIIVQGDGPDWLALEDIERLGRVYVLCLARRVGSIVLILHPRLFLNYLNAPIDCIAFRYES